MNFDIKILQLLQSNAGTDIFNWNMAGWQTLPDGKTIAFNINNKNGFNGMITIKEVADTENLFSLMFCDFSWNINFDIAMTVLMGNDLSKFITNLAGDHKWSAGDLREKAKKEPCVQAEGGRAPQDMNVAHSAN